MKSRGRIDAKVVLTFQNVTSKMKNPSHPRTSEEVPVGLRFVLHPKESNPIQRYHSFPLSEKKKRRENKKMIQE
jgi:hypothetical protein